MLSPDFGDVSRHLPSDQMDRLPDAIAAHDRFVPAVLMSLATIGSLGLGLYGLARAAEAPSIPAAAMAAGGIAGAAVSSEITIRLTRED